MSDRGKIRARRVSGNCTQHQREVAIAIKTARELALLPYTQRTTTERPGGRGGGRGGRRRLPGSGRPPAAATRSARCRRRHADAVADDAAAGRPTMADGRGGRRRSTGTGDGRRPRSWSTRSSLEARARA